MGKSTIRITLLAAGVVLTAGAATPVPPGPNQVKFPENWNKGVLYGTVDRYDSKQYRELYTSAETVAAVRAGQPVPMGTVLTMAVYKAKLDAAGNPVKDANGRFNKDELTGIFAMEKNRGYGDAIPAEIRNGDWQYQAFAPDGKVNDKANLTACYECHKPFAKTDYLTNMAKLAGNFPSGAQVAARSGPADVTINGFTFGPGKVTIAPGQQVTWTNGDDTPHIIAVTGKNERSELMLKGQSASLKFDEAGSFAYVCGLHPNMKGTIEVAKQ